jgi:hypothetical protein
MISNSEFEKVIDCLPEGFTWGSALTPDIALHIVNAAESSRIAQLETQLAEAKKDQARYQWIQDWLESRTSSTSAFCKAVTRIEYDQAIDAAIASIQEGK